MRRFFPLIIAVVAIFLVTLGTAWAHSVKRDEVVKKQSLAPFSATDFLPARDKASGSKNSFVYGKYSSDALGKLLDKREQGSAPQPASSGTSVRITARVLPCVSIKTNNEGKVLSIETNTPSRNLDETMILIDRELTPRLWDQIQQALLRAAAGTGTIYS